ncbi:MAG: phosphatidylglycerol lysyltransferase domain-containing protein, partial [Polyangiaceae bacterium]
QHELEGFARVLLGEQPIWHPASWPATLAANRRLREQIRRARAKGVRVRRVDAAELGPSSPLRAEIDALAEEWLRSRHMAPMAFLVSLELFHCPAEHVYFMAERGGRVVEFLSAVPVYAKRGWLIEDVVRTRLAPNGTTEALVDAVMRELKGSAFVTLGLAPLSGPVAPLLRAVRWISRPLFDFAGLRAFRQRLRPSHWEGVWLVYPRSEWAAGHIIESLRAFAGGSLVAFGVQSLIRRPSGLPWALALPLIPWTLLLTALALAGHADIVGFSRAALLGWATFDALLAAQLLRSALRPRPARLVGSAVAAIGDAGLSVPHLIATGLGTTLAQATSRGLAAVAPCFGAVVLTWAAAQGWRTRARAYP